MGNESLKACRRDRHSEEQTENVNNDVAFATVADLAVIKAHLIDKLDCFGRPAVDDGGAGFRVVAC